MKESEYIHKSHNVSVLLYHFVCLAKYRKVAFSPEVDDTLREVCLEIEKRYELHFLEIGTDKNCVHFLLQSVPMKSPTQIIKILKSITARELFRLHPEIKKQLWGGSFWSSGYFVNTVSKFEDESTILKYVRDQGIEKDYQVLDKI
ncbi:IS200/IS605 family transposase [Aquimarina addita]|uniref:IS200/IS605 family transposase n=1 Tax=Aquimarina addita TaxID=870485 RepID=UPI0031E75D67